jgi:hypothetical protein
MAALMSLLVILIMDVLMDIPIQVRKSRYMTAKMVRGETSGPKCAREMRESRDIYLICG